MSKSHLKILLPVAVVAISMILFLILTKLRPEVEKKDPAPHYPKVELYTVQAESMGIRIHAQGSVHPRQNTRLTARVSGHIEWVSPEFYEGGAFKKGDILLRLDPLPYKSALAETRSRLALAESVHWQEIEAAEQARRDWESVGEGKPSPLVLREPQLEKAKADLDAAKVAVQMAEDNLSYTEIKAPYDGRVQSKQVDVGQAITAQATVLGEIFSTDAMEVPLAISMDDLALIPGGTEGTPLPTKPKVILQAEIAGQEHTWEAYLDRTAASIDQRTRMISAYARMDPPFLSDKGVNLKPGMFVSAYIEGDQLDNAMRIPRAAVQPGNIVYRFTEGNRLEAVPLDILRTDAEWAITTNGLRAGDRICLTPLLFFVDGMQVVPVEPLGTETGTNKEPMP